MSKTFAGFSPRALTFLRQLKKNNSRDWFIPRKPQFEELLKQPMLELTGIVAEQMRLFAVDYVREPSKAVFRIYRDVRFSKDKTPYHTHISAMFFRAGLIKPLSAGFYFSVSPEAVEIAGGLYMPGAAELAAIRKSIVDDPVAFKKKVEPANLVKLFGPCKGDRMTRPPKGFDGHEGLAAELLTRKQFYYVTIQEAALATKPGLDRRIVKAFKALAPMVEFINQSILAGVQEADESPKSPVRLKPMF